jgi:hypothetical protein
MSKFRWDHELLYLGRFIRGTDLPWHYIPVWISITTPLLYLGLFLVGTFIALRQIASRGIALWQGDEELQDVVFLGLVVTPVGAVILLHSVVYDGWRHLYFIYPAFMLLAIRGWVFIWGNDLVWTIRKSLLAIVTVISIVYTTAWMWKAHPFQNVYFNILAGSEPRSRYELDYWGLSNRKALEYIVKNDQSDVICVRADSWTSLDRSFEMIDSRDRKRLRYVARDDVVVNDPGPRQCDDPRYIVTNYRLVKDPDDRKYAEDYDLFYQIRVDNEVILSVFRRKGM